MANTAWEKIHRLQQQQQQQQRNNHDDNDDDDLQVLDLSYYGRGTPLGDLENDTQDESSLLTQLADVIRRSTSLKTIKLQNNQIRDQPENGLFPGMGMRRRANVDGSGLQDIQKIFEALGMNTSVTHIDLRGNRIGEVGVRGLAQALQMNRTLTWIDLGSNLIGDLGAQDLAYALRMNRTLNWIDLRGNRIGDLGARELAYALRMNTTLNWIDLRGNHIGDPGAYKFAEALQLNRTLTGIDLSDNEIGDHTIPEFGRSILQTIQQCCERNKNEPQRAQPEAQSLPAKEEHQSHTGGAAAHATQSNLSSSEYKGAEDHSMLEKKIQRIQSNDPSFTEADFSINPRRIGGAIRIGENEDMLQQLSDALKGNTILTNINLSSNRMGTHGAQCLASALRVNTTLTIIVLVNNRIGDQGAQSLSDALRVNTNLADIDLRFNEIHDQSILRDIEQLCERNKNEPHRAQPDAQSPFAEEEHQSQKDEAASNMLPHRDRPSSASASAQDHSMAEGKIQRIRNNDPKFTEANLSIPLFHLGKEGGMLEQRIGVQGAQSLADALQGNTSLTFLDLLGNRIGDGGAKRLADALRENRTLTYINLANNEIGDQGAQCLTDALRVNMSLTNIGLAGNRIGDQGALYMAGVLRLNTILTFIDLSGNEVVDSSILQEIRRVCDRNKDELERAQQEAQGMLEEGIFDTVEHESQDDEATGQQQHCATTENYMSLCCWSSSSVPERIRGFYRRKEITEHIQVNDPGYLELNLTEKSTSYQIRQISNALRKNTNLIKMSCEHKKLSATDVHYLSDALRTNNSLTALYLLDNRISSQGAQYLADSLQVNASLVALTLRGNQIDDGGAQSLAETLQVNAHLSAIDLANNGLTTESAKHLADALRKNNTLKVLNLANNEISDEGARYLLEALGVNKSIFWVALNGNKIADQCLLDQVNDMCKRNQNER